MSLSRPAALAAMLVFGAGCAAARPLYDPDGLRAEVRARAPGLAPDEIVIPFEFPESQGPRARRIVEGIGAEKDRVRALVNAMFDPYEWGLRYSAQGATTNASETLERRAGNCLDLASVFIGLSRSVGIRASYMDASRSIRETRALGDGLTVNAGHITAVVESAGGPITLDFSSERDIVSYRVISDLEAIANFYNNRGFERIEAAEDQGVSVDWADAAGDFRRAVQVFPAFARAWNNLGIAAARLGRPDEAVAHYRAAIALDPGFAAPHNNLGLLHLRRGELGDALRELESAARLAPTAAHTQYELAVARQRVGDVDGAREAAERALQLRKGYPEAESLLRSLP